LTRRLRLRLRAHASLTVHLSAHTLILSRTNTQRLTPVSVTVPMATRNDLGSHLCNRLVTRRGYRLRLRCRLRGRSGLRGTNSVLNLRPLTSPTNLSRAV